MKIMIRFFLLLLSLNVGALQFLQPTDGQNTVKQKLGRSEQPLPTTQILTQLNKDAKSGDVRAQLSLAKMYHRGINVTRDMKLAFYWYSQVAESGYSIAQFNLAELYYSGVGTEKNLKQAVFWYSRAAQQDFIDAQYKLATMYHYGRGVEVDYVKARYWYGKAAKLGFAPAQLALGKLYDKGEGTAKDLAEAQHWYEAAAVQSNAEAQYYLAVLFERQEKFVQALLMYQQSAEQKFTKAQLRLAKLYYQGRLSEKDDIEALKLALIVAEKGNVEAQFLVASIYHYSTQVEQDLEQARYWYDKAFKQGHTSAESFLRQINANIADNKKTENDDQIVEISEKPPVKLIESSLSESSEKPIITTIPDAKEIKRSLLDNMEVLDKNIKALTLSAKKGNSTAQHNLSILFSIGALVPKNNTKAFTLMQKSARQGAAQSQNSLAMMYFKGIGVKANYQSAYFWVASSAKQGNQEGKKILSHISRYKQ
jgi:TPR repeat protein